MSLKEVVLPSGAKLEITMAPFADAKALYQAACSEAQGLKVDPKADVDVNLFKDLFCMALSSKKIEDALAPCMRRATYKGLKIDAATWEAEEAREDYLMACFEIAQVNIRPFTKSLSVQFAGIFESLKKLQTLR